MISSLSAIFVKATSTKSFASATISLEHAIGSSENIIGFATEDGSTSSSLSSSTNHLRFIKRKQEDKNTCRLILKSCCRSNHNHCQESIGATRLASCPRKNMSTKSQNFEVGNVGLHASSNMSSALLQLLEILHLHRAELYHDRCNESIFMALRTN